MSFEGKISGSLAPQGAKVGNLSGNIGAVVPDIRDESVTTAKLADEAVTTAKIADAAVTIAKLAQDVTALINSKGDASDVAQLQEDVAALQTITAGLGTASTYGVANNLTTAAAGTDVLDAYQGKVLSDTLAGKLSSDNVVIQSGHSIYEYVRTMTGGTYAFIRAQNASDNPAGTGLVCYCIAYSPGNNGAYAAISAFASAQTYMSNQLSPSATSITWSRTDSNEKVKDFYTKYFSTSGNYTKLNIHNTYDQQRYFLFGSGAGNTTLCAIIYIRTSGTAYCQTMGTKSVIIEKSGENGVLTVGQWGSGTLICDSPFTVTYVA